jgi:hypothetical protein
MPQQCQMTVRIATCVHLLEGSDVRVHGMHTSD